jgi:hypothetical protein
MFALRKHLTILLVLLCVGWIMVAGAWVNAAEFEITIGIKDPGFQRNIPLHSAWRGVSHADAHGGSYFHDGGSVTPELYGTWTPHISIPGTYNVYMRWIAHPNRSSAATVHIKHLGGITETTVDQRDGGKQWNLLGQFEFDAGMDGYVRLFSAPGYTIFEAVRFELVGDPTIPEGIDLDITHPDFTTVGQWQPVDAGDGQGYLESTGTAAYNAATWMFPSNLTAGEYEVYIYHVPGQDRPKEAQVHVKFDLGLDTEPRVDQTNAGWEKIGRYHFTPGYKQYISLVHGGAERLAAVKVRLVRIKPYPFRTYYIPGDVTSIAPTNAARYSGAIPVQIHQDEQGRFSLTRGGEPYFIKGVCGSEDLAAVADAGGNALRTYSHTALNGYAVLDEAHERGIGVFIGIWLTQQDKGIDYANPFYKDHIASQLEMAKQVVLQYKDHPAVIGWAIGNEVDKGKSEVWYHINEIAKFIHENDPHHPSMVVLAGAHPARVALVRTRAPYVDILGINTYRHIGDVYNNVVNLGGWQGPYMITEWGPDAAFEVAVANGVAPIEHASNDKALLYYQRYQDYIVHPSVRHRVVGSFAFKLADVFGGTHTWYNILLEDSKKTPQLDALIKAWTGNDPQNHAPRVRRLSLTSTGYHRLTVDPAVDGSVVLSPGERFLMQADVFDLEDDPLTYRWEVRLEFKQGVTGAPPAVLSNMLIEPAAGSQAAAYIVAPSLPGDYRVYFYAYDQNHNIGSHTFPFRVE